MPSTITTTSSTSSSHTRLACEPIDSSPVHIAWARRMGAFAYTSHGPVAWARSRTHRMGPSHGRVRVHIAWARRMGAFAHTSHGPVAWTHHISHIACRRRMRLLGSHVSAMRCGEPAANLPCLDDRYAFRTFISTLMHMASEPDLITRIVTQYDGLEHATARRAPWAHPGRDRKRRARARPAEKSATHDGRAARCILDQRGTPICRSCVARIKLDVSLLINNMQGLPYAVRSTLLSELVEEFTAHVRARMAWQPPPHTPHPSPPLHTPCVPVHSAHSVLSNPWGHALTCTYTCKCGLCSQIRGGMLQPSKCGLGGIGILLRTPGGICILLRTPGKPYTWCLERSVHGCASAAPADPAPPCVMPSSCMQALGATEALPFWRDCFVRTPSWPYFVTEPGSPEHTRLWLEKSE